MNLAWFLSGFVQGLVGGVVTLVILAARAAIEGKTGVTFADLGTALAVGIVVGVLPVVIARLVAWRARRIDGAYENRWVTLPGSSDRPAKDRPGGRPASTPAEMDRFNRFTDRARKVLTLAQDEAQRFDHNYIGTEHLLLGLVREGDGVAAQALESMGVELAKIRTAVEFIIGRGGGPVVGEVGLTPRAKRVIELAIDEARRLGHNYIGTEHLLLGLVREGEGIAAGVLESLGVNLDRVRREVIRVLEAGGDSG
jgi:hypothetical protein